MKVVIVGSGRTGTTLASSLAASGHSITIIDVDGSNAEGLVDSHSSGGEIHVVEGDGTRDATLEQARIRDADLFAALTGEDSTNGMAALKARIKYRVMTVIAAIWSGDLSSVYESLGVACVNPGRLSADSVIANIPQVLQGQSDGPGEE